jgi:hypothetical protein
VSLHPFFTYFGGKWRAAPHYPAPRHDLLIEPFAGSAGYALRYPEQSVVLCEADKTMRGVWAWLLSATPDDLRGLPDVPAGKTVDDFGLSQGARDFVGLWMNKGMTGPCVTPSSWLLQGIRPKSSWGPTLRGRLAAQLLEIRHWTLLDDYRAAPDVEATWFIDPPYQGRLGRRYRSKVADYEALGEWCRTRKGQVIVCENEGADWLPFQTFRTIKGTEGKGRTGVSHEVIWTNETSEDEVFT